jgi:hypothetical protein
MNFLKKSIYASLATLSLAAASNAAIIPVYQSTTADGSDFRWSYTASVGSGIRVQTGDYFTIYDFGGLDGGAIAPAGWTFSTAVTGPVPILLAPADDSTIPNVTFMYTGASIIGPASLGTFSVDSIGNQSVTTAWASDSTRNGGTQDGNFASDLGSVLAPSDISNPNIPEPAVGILALGLIGSGSIRRRR